MGARVLGFQCWVMSYRWQKPETQNRRLETEDACTDDCPGLLTRSLLALKGTRSVVKLNHYHLFFDTTTT